MRKHLFALACAALLLAPGAWAEFDVRDFGALGNDVDNDAPAFNAAVDAAEAAGGTVRVPPGRYRLGTPAFYSGVFIEDGGISFICDAGAVLLPHASATEGMALLAIRKPKSDTSGIPATDVIVRGCTFLDDAPGAHAGNEESHGVYIVDGVNISVRENRFIDIGDEAVYMNRSSDVRIRDNFFQGTPQVGLSGGSIDVAGSTDVIISDNQLDLGLYTGGGTFGINVRSTEEFASRRVIIANNTFRELDPNPADQVLHPIFVYAAGDDIFDIVIEGNTVAMAENMTSPAISVRSSTSFVPDGVTIVGNLLHRGGGIKLHGRNATVSGNVIREPRKRGIHVAAGARLFSIVGNVIRDAEMEGVLSYGDDVLISGNLVSYSSNRSGACISAKPTFGGAGELLAQTNFLSGCEKGVVAVEVLEGNVEILPVP